MSHLDQMLRSHPQKPQVDETVLRNCIDACLDCLSSCSACSDACLAEEDVQPLVRCIRLNQDCADVCGITARILSRKSSADWAMVRSMLETCAMACQECGQECGHHADHHEHCRFCAQACGACEQACNDLIVEVPAALP